LEEIDIAEIEARILEYPVQARRDIIMLTAELRALRGFDKGAKARGPGSPLYDAATGLLNAGAYGVRFAGARARAARYKKRFAIMSIDLALAEGSVKPGEIDRVLKLVADRLEQCVRATDTLARIDHEKFAIILEDLPADEQAEQVTEKVRRTLADPIDLGSLKVYPDANIGIQFYPQSEETGPRPALNS
jgi:diguanylate cyclase (GGDEF)-like protein